MIAAERSVSLLVAGGIFAGVLIPWEIRVRLRWRRAREAHRAVLASRLRPAYKDPMWGLTTARPTNQRKV